MNTRGLLLTIVLVVLFLVGASYGQELCFGGGAPNEILDSNNCIIGSSESYYQGTMGAYFYFSVYIEPNSGPPPDGGAPISGVLTGDLGNVQYNNPQIAPPILSFPCGNYGYPTTPLLVAGTYYLAGTHIATATFTTCSNPVQSWTATLAVTISSVPPPSSAPCSIYSPLLIDPVASNLLGGSGVTQNANTIAGASNPSYVSGAAADGVTQVIVEVPTGQAGDTVQLTLLNENGQQDSAANDGGLFPLGGSSGSTSSTLTVQAEATSPPMAFAIWRAPANYYRGSQDSATYRRSLSLQAQCTNAGGSPTTVSQQVWTIRPPVVLVHGLWSSPDAWNNFSPTSNNSLWNVMFKSAANYNFGVSGVTATSPPYAITPTGVNANTLGFAFNAPTVLNAVLKAIGAFETVYNVAAVQADVVAHSLGGAIVRVMPGATTPTGTLFATQNNYGMGPVHKLITIGTPHQGTPLAVDLLPSGLGDSNSCVRNTLATFGKASFQTVTFGSSTLVNGAVGDIAAAPASLPSSEPFPMAYLAGNTSAVNLQGIDAPFTRSYWLRNLCLTYFGSGLAYDLSPTLWNNVFSGPNDGIVPVTGQLNLISSVLNTNTFAGIIHSPALLDLNFSGPSELDAQASPDLPDAVVNLLNEATNGPDFH